MILLALSLGAFWTLISVMFGYYLGSIRNRQYQIQNPDE
jgi:hypothetical protein